MALLSDQYHVIQPARSSRCGRIVPSSLRDAYRYAYRRHAKKTLSLGRHCPLLRELCIAAAYTLSNAVMERE
jgi:hypothetical protein